MIIGSCSFMEIKSKSYNSVVYYFMVHLTVAILTFFKIKKKTSHIAKSEAIHQGKKVKGYGGKWTTHPGN